MTTYMLIDTHAHLDFNDNSPQNITGLVDRAKAAGVTTIIHIGSGDGTKSYAHATTLADSFPNVFTTLGVHPHEANQVNTQVLQDIEKLSSHPKVVAIGEVGLDFHYNHSDQASQELAFRQFIALARKVKKPLSIHSRNCDATLLKIMEEEKAAEVGGIIHCFSSDYPFAQKMLELNFYISFSGIVTFKKAQSVRAAATQLPLNRILIETDSPYLAPVPYRGKPNEPAYVKFVAEKIAELRKISFEEVAHTTTANAKQLLKI